MPRVVAYTWTSGTTAGDPGDLDATSTLGIREQATSGTLSYVRPAVPMPLYAPQAATDQLRQWKAGADALPSASVYTLTYSPTTRRVTLASTVDWRPVLPENTLQWLGFIEPPSILAWATSWTGDAEPSAIMELLGATVDAVEDWALVDLSLYRHGRARAVGWGSHYAARVALHVRADRYAGKQHCLTGRVQIVQIDSVTTPYSPDNPGGIVDGFVVAVGDVSEIDSEGQVLQVPMVLAVPRSL